MAGDALADRLLVPDQDLLFADLRGREMDALQIPHHGHPGQPRGIVLVGLPLDVLTLPGFFVGAADVVKWNINVPGPVTGTII